MDRNLSENDQIIFPNKRSASLCKNAFVQKSSKTSFLPNFITIEELICDCSGLSIADPLDLKFILFTHYREVYQENETVDQVFSWANQLINDFSEIDRNLVNQKDLLGYLKAVKEIEHWSKMDQPTEMISNYLKFWNKLPVLYNRFKEDLLEQGVSYQGLAYRKALDYLNQSIKDLNNNFYFIGFNALNKAEEEIFQLILEAHKAEVFWDIDAYYWKQKHSASYFLRQYQQQWKVLENDQHRIQSSTQSFSSDKNFSIYSNQGNIQQAKAVGEIINQLDDNEIKNTAVLLGDEFILESLLFAVPKQVQTINITMGLSLHKTSIGAFFTNYIKLCKTDQNAFFHKDVLSLLESSFLMYLFKDDCKKVRDIIIKDQIFFLNKDDIKRISEATSADFQEFFLQLFTDIPAQAELLNRKIQLLLQLLLSKTDQAFSKKMIDKTISVFQAIQSYLSTYQIDLGWQAYLNLYQEVITQEQIDLRGEKDKGLQIMGLLESRCLDFKNVIITSVNEGILPQGKTAGSFIPFDLKKQYDLPTYQEKDKVYSYHFFRILQRATDIHLLYNDLSSNLSFSEESRFIKILEENQLENHQITRFHTTLNTKPFKREESIQNSSEVQKELKQWMTKGKVSATALTTYIRNPYVFYQKYVIGLKDPVELNDLESPNIFGNVVHNSLEKIYKKLPFQQNITVDHLQQMKHESEKVITNEILNLCGSNAFDKGSNLLGFEAVKKQIDLFLNEEIELVKDNELQILAIEVAETFKLENNLFDQPIMLNGKVDRIDQLNGKKRIVDYKTGAGNKLNLTYFEDLITDEKKAHAFQTLFYSLIKKEMFNQAEEWQAGNIYLKDKDKKFRPLNIGKSNQINHDLLHEYQSILHQLLSEIYDIKIPFNNKEMVL